MEFVAQRRVDVTDVLGEFDDRLAVVPEGLLGLDGEGDRFEVVVGVEVGLDLDLDVTDVVVAFVVGGDAQRRNVTGCVVGSQYLVRGGSVLREGVDDQLFENYISI